MKIKNVLISSIFAASQYSIRVFILFRNFSFEVSIVANNKSLNSGSEITVFSPSIKNFLYNGCFSISATSIDAPINPIPGTEIQIRSSLDLLDKASRILPSRSLISLSRLSITARYDWRRTRHNEGIDAGNVAEMASAFVLILFGSELMISSNGLF